MTREELLQRLADQEDNFTERKPRSHNRDDIRKSVVAFANSLPEARSGVLFLGVRNDGRVEGIDNPDKLQKTVREVCEQDCYPAIAFSSEVLTVGQAQVVAVVVSPSARRPHFAGPAYVRRGSESVVASDQVFEELVWSHNSKCAAILKLKNQVVTVIGIQHRLGEPKRIADSNFRETAECRVLGSNPQSVRFQILASGRYVTEPLEHLTVGYDENRHRPMLIVRGY